MNRVCAFIGPKGGGKDYALEEYKNNLSAGSTVITTDFSDGIREMAEGIIYGNKFHPRVSNLSPEYAEWKESENEINRFDMRGVEVRTGRDILIGIGETAKCLFGEDIWAKYCEKYVKNVLNTLEGNLDTVVLFGSTRFMYEVQAVLNIAEFIGVEPEFIFCNYNNVSPGKVVDKTERLAQCLIDLGCEHREIITNKIYTLCKNK